MKQARVLFLLLPIFVCACGSDSDYPAADNAFDAGREFIDGCLKGDFTKAAFYMVSDDENNKDLLQIKRVYNEKGIGQKQEYSTASIVIQQEETLSDTVHIIHYMNSYDKIARKVKVVLRDNTWKTDFKYTFDGNL